MDQALHAYIGTALPPELLAKITLVTGSHDARERGVCAMELVAWLAGEPHTDEPQCACPAIRWYVINLNDSGPQWLRDAIQARALKIVGTRGSVELQKRRIRLMVEGKIKHAELVLPIFENRFPEDDRPRKAIQAAKGRIQGKIVDAASAASAAYAAAYAATSAATSAAYAAASAATSAADAAAYAAYAAYAADAASAASAASAADAADPCWQIYLDTLDAVLELKEAM